MSIDLEQFNRRLATFQENNPSMSVQELLDEKVNEIIEKSDINIPEEKYIDIYDTELTKLENTKMSKKLPASYDKDKHTTKVNDSRSKRVMNRLNKLVEKSPNFATPATNIDNTFYFINDTFIEDKAELGIWYKMFKPLHHIIDNPIKVLRVITTDTTSKDKHMAYELEVTSKNGDKHVFTVTNSNLTQGHLKMMFSQFVDRYPTTKTTESLLFEALQILANQSDVIRQVEKDTLGYHVLNGERVYLLSNGVETKKGFIPLETSQLIPPSIVDNANGYKGKNISTINDDIMKELFCNLNTDISVQIIMLALLGASCIVSYPIGDYNGTLPFAIEIVGNNGHGKTPLLNYALSFFGIDFTYHKGTLFNNTLSSGDTEKARGKAVSKMKYTLFADSDNKDTPNTGKSFEKSYEIRNKTNSSIADKAGRTYLTITREERNVEPLQGVLIRTGNYDYALLSIERDNTPVEKRTCTFLWNVNAYSNRDVSKAINARREEYYAIGASYRNWCLNLSDNALLTLFECAKEIAEMKVAPYEWTSNDAYKEHTIAFIIGLELFKLFLKEKLPDSFMLSWIDTAIPQLIQNRIDRTNFIFSNLEKQLEDDTLDHILKAIAIQFANGEMYVVNQKDSPYKNKDTDIPYCGLDSLGYREGKIGRVKVGYVVSNGESIAFKKDILFNQLVKYGKQNNIDFKSMKHIEEILTEHKLVVLNDNGKRKDFYKINQKSMRLLGISVSSIYPDIEIEETSNETPDNIISLTQKKEVYNVLAGVKEMDLDSTESF